MESTRSAKAVLKDAKSVLSSVADRNHPASPTAAGTATSSQGQNLLLHCVELLEEFQRLLKNGAKFEFKDWTVLKAVAELVVRWGIYPYLSPGVGIPLRTRFGDIAASAAADALSDYFRESESVRVPERALTVRHSDAHPLVFSADRLSCIILEKIVIKPSDSPETAEISGNSLGTREKDDSTAEDEDEKYQGKYTPAVVSSPAALRQHVLSHHLIDILAALLQIAHGEQVGISWKEEAIERIRTILARLPVDYVVEALFSLLGQGTSIAPPSWLKPEVGKLLSNVVVKRNGALATVMERLSGGADSGSVHVYQRVAAHLAKVPRHVCTEDEYYKAACTELRMMLFLPDISYLDSKTSKAHRNMHHTSIILACLLAHQEPSLTEKYLLRPIVEPLLTWSESPAAENERNISAMPERSLLDGLHVLKLLLTAGHDKSSNLRELLLRLTSPLVPKLILLEYLLCPPFRKYDARRLGGPEQVAVSSVSKANQAPQRKDHIGGEHKDGFKVGFLEGKRLYNVENDKDEVKGTVGHLMGCITDIVGCHLTRPALHVVPILFTFLLELSPASLSWPSAEGDIADALEACKQQADTPAMFISKLLLTGEYWELSLALLDKVLRTVLGLRKTARMRSTVANQDHFFAQSVKLLDTLEVLYVEVCIKAVEKDATGALPLLKILLNDDDVLRDGEMMELVLRLLHSAVSQLHEDHKNVDDDDNVLMRKRAEQITLLNSLGSSLERITVSAEVPKEAKEFAASLRSTISHQLSKILTRTEAQ